MKCFRAQLTVGIVLLTVTGCGKPPVSPVPITAPWSTMNLPIDESAIVWGSNANEIKILHRGRIEVVAEAYVNYFEQGNWTTTKRERFEHAYSYSFRKDAERMNVEIYIFKDVGVIIERTTAGLTRAPLGRPPVPPGPPGPPTTHVGNVPASQAPQSTLPAPPPPSPPLATGEQYLREIMPTSLVALPEGREHAFDRQFSVQRVSFEKGVYFCPPTANSTGSAVFPLDMAYTRLKGGVAISDHRFGRAYSPVTFRVLGDGKTLWTSKPLQRCGEWEAFEIDVTGVKQLTLDVTCPASHTGAHGAWMDPILVKS